MAVTKKPKGATPQRKSKAGRKLFKLDGALIANVERLLRRGSTDKDVCELTNISQTEFYLWLQVGRAVKGLEAMPTRAPVDPERRELCAVFTDAVTRARAQARQLMTEAIVRAAEGLEGHETTIELFEETRINPKTGEPYQYVKRITKDKTIEYAPNPSIALEYLQRRDKANWSVRTESVEMDFEVEIVKAIQAGEVTFSALMDEFKNETQVRGWFKAAGVKPIEDDFAEVGNEA